MISVFDSLAWRLTRQLDPSFSGAEETFIAAGKSLRLDAYEQYIRGITEPDQAERLRHLQQAVKLSPDFGAAWMALGREDYQDQQYDRRRRPLPRWTATARMALKPVFIVGFRCSSPAAIRWPSRPLHRWRAFFPWPRC